MSTSTGVKVAPWDHAKDMQERSAANGTGEYKVIKRERSTKNVNTVSYVGSWSDILRLKESMKRHYDKRAKLGKRDQYDIFVVIPSYRLAGTISDLVAWLPLAEVARQTKQQKAATSKSNKPFTQQPLPQTQIVQALNSGQYYSYENTQPGQPMAAYLAQEIQAYEANEHQILANRQVKATGGITLGNVEDILRRANLKDASGKIVEKQTRTSKKSKDSKKGTKKGTTTKETNKKTSYTAEEILKKAAEAQAGNKVIYMSNVDPNDLPRPRMVESSNHFPKGKTFTRLGATAFHYENTPEGRQKLHKFLSYAGANYQNELAALGGAGIVSTGNTPLAGGLNLPTSGFAMPPPIAGGINLQPLNNGINLQPLNNGINLQPLNNGINNGINLQPINIQPATNSAGPQVAQMRLSQQLANMAGVKPPSGNQANTLVQLPNIGLGAPVRLPTNNSMTVALPAAMPVMGSSLPVLPGSPGAAPQGINLGGLGGVQLGGLGNNFPQMGGLGGNQFGGLGGGLTNLPPIGSLNLQG